MAQLNFFRPSSNDERIQNLEHQVAALGDSIEAIAIAVKAPLPRSMIDQDPRLRFFDPWFKEIEKYYKDEGGRPIPKLYKPELHEGKRAFSDIAQVRCSIGYRSVLTVCAQKSTARHFDDFTRRDDELFERNREVASTYKIIAADRPGALSRSACDCTAAVYQRAKNLPEQVKLRYLGEWAPEFGFTAMTYEGNSHVIVHVVVPGRADDSYELLSAHYYGETMYGLAAGLFWKWWKLSTEVDDSFIRFLRENQGKISPL